MNLKWDTGKRTHKSAKIKSKHLQIRFRQIELENLIETVLFRSHRQSSRQHWIDEYRRLAATYGHRIKCLVSLDWKIMEIHGKQASIDSIPTSEFDKLWKPRWFFVLYLQFYERSTPVSQPYGYPRWIFCARSIQGTFLCDIPIALHTISILNCDKRHENKLRNEFHSNSIYMQKWNEA